MFEIEYKGGNTVVLSTKKSRLVVDPKRSVFGEKDLSVKDAVEVATEERFAIDDESARLAIEGPGEYEVGDFSIRGVKATRHIDSDQNEQISTIYQIVVKDDVRCAIIGNVESKLSEEQLEEIGIVDVLVIPVGGGGYTLDASSAASLTRHIDPKVVIPVHYADKALKYEVPQDDLGVFTRELGAPVETVAKYKLKSKGALPVVLTCVEVTRS